MIERGDWIVSDVARNAFDLEGKVVGTIGAGRIGYRVLQRLVPFDCKELLYYDYTPLPAGNTSFLNIAEVVSHYPSPAPYSCFCGHQGSQSRGPQSKFQIQQLWCPCLTSFEPFRNLFPRFVRKLANLIIVSDAMYHSV